MYILYIYKILKILISFNKNLFKIKKMNENAFDTLKYMCIHLFIFLFKNIFAKWLSKLSKRNVKSKHEKELDELKRKRDNLKEEIREVSSINEYVKFTKMERKINNLNEEIKKKESIKYPKNINDNKSDMNIFQKIIDSILNSFLFKFFMYFINVFEYFFLKNYYFEIHYESNKNNILVNYYYNENKNPEYSLIPISRILICETFVLNSSFNLIKKYI